jgi:ABC-2 type transport system ATP-binding protein
MTTHYATRAIEVRDLEKSFKDVRVLRGVDLDVGQGSIFALHGSNGAGKTTLVKILATLLRADVGTVRVPDCCMNNARIASTMDVTGWCSAKARTGPGIVSHAFARSRKRSLG